jgi:hypothetical protein
LNVRRGGERTCFASRRIAPLGPGTRVRNGIDKKPEMLGPFVKRDIALLIFKLTSPSYTAFRSSPSSVLSFLSFLPKRGIAVPILKAKLVFLIVFSSNIRFYGTDNEQCGFPLSISASYYDRYYSANLQAGVVSSLISLSISAVMERTISNAGFCGFLLNVIVRRPLILRMTVWSRSQMVSG